MRGKLRVFRILMILVCAAFTVQAANAIFKSHREVGVDVGDWARFGEFSVSYTSNDPSPPLTISNDSYSVKSVVVKVFSVSNTTIEYTETSHFFNGSATPSYEAWVDVETGEGAGSVFPWFVSANLSVGESIYGSGDFSLAKLDATFNQTFAGWMREVNYLNYTATSSFEGYNLTLGLECYWDKVTGFLLESKISWNYTLASAGYVTLVSISLRVEQISLWGSRLVGDVDHDGAVDIYDLVVVASIYGCQEDDPKWVSEADVAPQYGVIDLLDFVTIASHYGESWL